MNRLLKLKRTWTAAEADEWTKEDVVAAALAVVCFVAVSFGTPYAFLLRPVGFLLLGGGILAGLVMLWLISDPSSMPSRLIMKRSRRATWKSWKRSSSGKMWMSDDSIAAPGAPGAFAATGDRVAPGRKLEMTTCRCGW